MKRRLRQGLSSVMVAAMLVGNLPSAAFAEENTQKPGWSADYSAYFYEVEGNLYKADATVEVLDPTCTENGKKVYTVNVEGVEPHTEDSGEEATGHTADEAVKENVVAATCTEKGSYDEVVYCSVCNEELSRKEVSVDMIPHTPAEAVKENVIEPTCTEDGSHDEVVYCSVCGKELSRKNQTDAQTGHVWDEGEITTPATCTEDGVMTYTCTSCGETKEEAIPAGHHEGTPKKENVVAPTCTEGGSYDEVVYCDVCNEVLSKKTIETPAVGHSWDEGEVTKEATCTEDGVMTYTCTKCDETKEETIEATGEHTPGEWEMLRDETFVAPTCVEDGSHYEVRRCTVCGEIVEMSDLITVKATGHSWDEGEVTTPATCTEDGEMTYTCTTCGETEKETIPAGHTEAEAVQENVVAPTCTKDGSHDEVIYCSVCGEELSRENIVDPKTGHKEAEAVQENVVAPTCTEDGSHDEVVYCAVCGEELDRKEVTDEATGHNWEKIENGELAPTCTKAGAYLEKCSECGEVQRTEVEALGHTPLEAVRENEVAHTCTEDGSYDEVVYCEVCGEEISRETITDPAGHTEGEAVKENEVAPTCTEEGSYDEVVYCTVCGEELSRKTITVDALGHDWEEVVLTEPTCEEPGRSYGQCKRCKDVSENIEIPALGHDYKTSAKVYWSEDVPGTGYVVYTSVCQRDPEHKVEKVVNFTPDDEDTTYTVTKTSEVTKEPTCTEAGVETFTVTFSETVDETEVSDSTTYTVEIPALGHEKAEAVVDQDSVVKATCTEDGSYDLVVYCSTCGEELERSTVKEAATGHTAGEPKIENEINKGSATEDYEYDLVTYCENCNAELDRQHQVIEATGHKPGTAVIENRVEATCTEEGSYDEVVYCTDEGCVDDEHPNGAELKRVPHVIEPTGHTPGTAVIENRVEATCTENGSHDEVVYCEVCGEELDRKENIIDPATGHDAYFTKTVVTEPTCTEDGSSVDVTYCGVCFEEVWRDNEKVLEATGHKAAEAVRDPNTEVEPTDEEEGSYDMVVYCSVCGEELSRETFTVPSKNQTAADAVAEVLNNITDDSSKEEVEAARSAYESLSDAQKNLVSEETLKKLTDAEQAIKEAEEKAAEEKAAAERKAAEEKAAAEKKAAEEKAAAEKKAAEEKAAAEKKAAEEKAAAEKKAAEEKAAAEAALSAESDKAVAALVEKQLNALKGSSAGAADQVAVAAARSAYSALTDSQKALISAAALKQLTDSEAAVLSATTSKEETTITGFSPKVKNYKVSALKRKKRSYKLTIEHTGTGEVTYKKVKGNKKIKISSDGTVTVKKNLKKGTYKVVVQITIAETSTHKSVTMNKTIKVKVKK